MPKHDEIRLQGRIWRRVRDDGQTWLAACEHENTAVRFFFWKREDGEVVIFPPRDEGRDSRWFACRKGCPPMAFSSQDSAFRFGS